MRSCGLWEDITYINSLLACHSPSLIQNMTNNIAESLQNKIHSRLTNASPGEFMKKYPKSLEKKALKRNSQQDFPSSFKRKHLQFKRPDEHYRQKDQNGEIDVIDKEAMKAFLSSLSMEKAA
ncbi:hypothetical protein J437_LFUL016434 [Ladona fulva]|uniref:Uncharacterized protein n=1 Tax=Ladona fulva TaxID=123851 RepID=A0A8K0KRB4_LADFU|nr:hypothetical protein J437_LFUL016434 [Ladona fulva]